MRSPVYHGSNVIVVTPNILKENEHTDFGEGFYCTTSHFQAEQWALEKFYTTSKDQAVINYYELAEITKDFKFLNFKYPSIEWIRFVCNNRYTPDYEHEYDVVYGPLADNHLKFWFDQFKDGEISEEQLRQKAIEQNKEKGLKDQYLFHTKKALSLLTFIKAEIIEIDFQTGKKTKKIWTPKL